jgi:hypothetical protein
MGNSLNELARGSALTRGFLTGCGNRRVASFQGHEPVAFLRLSAADHAATRKARLISRTLFPD